MCKIFGIIKFGKKEGRAGCQSVQCTYLMSESEGGFIFYSAGFLLWVMWA